MSTDEGFTGITGTDASETSQINSLFSSLESAFSQTATAPGTSTKLSNGTSTTTDDAISSASSLTSPFRSSQGIASSTTSASKTPTSNSTTTSRPGNIPDNSGGLSTSAKAGIAVSLCLLGVLMAVFGILFRQRRYKKRAQRQCVREPGDNHEHTFCVYHQKAELDDTSTPRNSTIRLAADGSDMIERRRNTAELEVCLLKPYCRNFESDLSPRRDQCRVVQHTLEYQNLMQLKIRTRTINMYLAFH